MQYRICILVLVVLAGCSTALPGESPVAPTETADPEPTPNLERRAAEHTPTAACEPGTDPPAGTSDTSGDGIPDAWLVAGETPDGAPLPGGDPCRMNLYLQVAYTGEAGLPPGVLEETVRGFAEMPVRNPDGTTGIDLHVMEGPRLDETVTFTGDNFGDLRRTYYDSVTGNGSGVYHLALIVSYDDDVTRRKSGVAETPGRFAIIQNNPPSGDALVVHEILHNVVGVLPPGIDGRCDADPVHTCDGGYLYKGPVGGDPAFYVHDGDQRYLPLEIAELVESEGFATDAQTSRDAASD